MFLNLELFKVIINDLYCKMFTCIIIMTFCEIECEVSHFDYGLFSFLCVPTPTPPLLLDILPAICFSEKSSKVHKLWNLK